MITRARIGQELRLAGLVAIDLVGGRAGDRSPAQGNLLVAGQFEETMSLAGSTLTAKGYRDAFVAKYSADGKELYKEYCKTCHEADSPHGEYTPMSLIQDQWKRFFDKKYVRTHKDVIDEKHGGKPVTETISPEDLELIKEFAIEGAADSEHPMTCG